MQQLKTQRLFFAITLKPELQLQLINILPILHKHPGGHEIIWTPQEKLHVTLRFLGETPIEKIPSCINLIQSHLENIPTFEMTMDSLVSLPKRSPRIIALQVAISPALENVFQTVDQCLVSLGFTPERRAFFPHITLGRTRGRKISLTTLMQDITLPNFLPQQVTQIVLMRSETQPTGSVYRIVQPLVLNATTDFKDKA